MKTTIVISMIAALSLTAAAQEFNVDDEGFIRNWLVLGSIPVESGGGQEIGEEQIKDEGKLKPKAGDKLTVRGEKLEWKAAKADDYYFDFNVWLKRPEEDKAQNVIGYLACTIVAAEEMKGIQGRFSSNDQGRFYLNGKEAFTFDSTRSIDKDQDTVENLTLQKGENTIVLKIINEQNNWQGALRFTDKSGKPIKNVKVALAK